MKTSFIYTNLCVSKTSVPNAVCWLFELTLVDYRAHRSDFGRFSNFIFQKPRKYLDRFVSLLSKTGTLISQKLQLFDKNIIRKIIFGDHKNVLTLKKIYFFSLFLTLDHFLNLFFYCNSYLSQFWYFKKWMRLAFSKRKNESAWLSNTWGLSTWANSFEKDARRIFILIY